MNADQVVCSINNRHQARTFLNNITFDKNPIDRLASWMIFLDIFNPDKEKFSDCLKRIKEDYTNLLNKKLGNDWNNHAKNVPEKDLMTIKADIERSMKWFIEKAGSVGIKDIDSEEAEKLFKRVLDMLYHYDSYYSYYQSYDRYVYITYLITLQSNFNDQLLQESITFYLTQRILKIIALPELFERIKSNEEPLFSQIDKNLNKILPDKYRKISEAGGNAFQYSLKWRILIFSEEHTVGQIYLIWDNVFTRLNDFAEYFACLTYAHLAQVDLDDDEQSPIEIIQKNEKWDGKSLVKYATNKYNEIVGNRRKRTYIALAMLGLVIAAFYAMLFRRGLNK
ncbi:hypothetical protein GPJ56_001568 [Histomonas meleagridis]|uniref:uncharacterized protein n=1 Tax=Histomonas meleagridis TaxID=135588 RepID=UPI0035594E8E|nr:hypothetical protein GPJ56_001568 [Histomonas meleagridis]KAH0807074.1 hypothetical protein GO595_000250 [Histomonas meleagridis]